MKTLKIPTFALLGIIALLVLSLFAGPAQAELYFNAGVIGTNTTIEKCSGPCGIKVKNAGEPAGSVGYFFNNRIVDIGGELTIGSSSKVYLAMARKRLGKWSVEVGAGRYEQSFNVGSTSTSEYSQEFSGDNASGAVFLVGGTRKLGKNGSIFARYMHSNMGMTITRSLYGEGDGERYLVGTDRSKTRLDTDTLWVGYRHTF